ncbi:MAG: alpha/beta hydrolase [Acidobacteria bacterium]|nr:alpha/beta hydrolase [Acidobacteriota bacterium]
MKFAVVLAVLCPVFLMAQPKGPQPKVELLWPGGAPGAVGNEDVDRPSISIYLPPAASATGTGVVVCPGGGYAHLAMDHEGDQIARWLNSFGVAAFVLKYRLGPRYHFPAPLQDAQRAITLVRSRANEFGVDPHRIGIWGFSAGGHLASTAATHFNAENRPNFAILAYPVISFTTEYVHRGSMRNLLGDHPDPKLVQSLSNETQVTPQTPPTFLFHTTEDKTVPVENSILFYMALKKAGVPAEMHIYEHGPHGVGLAATDLVLSSWPRRLAEWMGARGLLGKNDGSAR